MIFEQIKNNQQTLKRIDGNLIRLEKMVGLSEDAHMQHAYIHFLSVWRSLCLQAGWPRQTIGTRSRKRQVIESIIESGSMLLREKIAWNKSPLWSMDSPTFPTTRALFYTVAAGFKMCSYGSDMWEPLANGMYTTELSENYVIWTAITNAEGFIDVGANIGYFSLFSAHLARLSGRRDFQIISCEPDHRNANCIRASVKKNGFRHIRVIECGIGREQGRGQLFHNIQGSGGHSFSPVNQKNYVGSQEVELTTLDTICAHLAGKRLVLKIDVEGFEKEVLLGGKDLLASTVPPLILIETIEEGGKKNNKDAVLDILSRAGYILYAVSSARHGQAWIRPLGKRANSPIGNYLAVPFWAQSVIKPLLLPADLRIFTPAPELQKMDLFITNSTEAFAKWK